MVEELKTSSNHWIKSKNLSPFVFAWQQGYGAFAHSKSQVPRIINYIRNHEEHHRGKKFREEYLEMLQKNEIEFNDKYLFEFFDEL